jgi:hypothetical protein
MFSNVCRVKLHLKKKKKKESKEKKKCFKNISLSFFNINYKKEKINVNIC